MTRCKSCCIRWEIEGEGAAGYTLVDKNADDLVACDSFTDREYCKIGVNSYGVTGDAECTSVDV